MIEDEKLLFKTEGIRVEVTMPEEICIIHEIWVEGCYNFNTKQISVLVDIDMNGGCATPILETRKFLKPISPTKKLYR